MTKRFNRSLINTPSAWVLGLCVLVLGCVPGAQAQTVTPTTVTLPAGVPSGSVAPNGIVNLTQEGTLGWAQWGQGGTTFVNQEIGLGRSASPTRPSPTQQGRQ